MLSVVEGVLVCQLDDCTWKGEHEVTSLPPSYEAAHEWTDHMRVEHPVEWTWVRRRAAGVAGLN